MFTYSAVIVDNDHDGSAERAVAEIASESDLRMEYVIQPDRSIALARNTAVRIARGDLIAFIDDDEYPESGWLLNLLRAYRFYHADAVLGPVRPHFETAPPAWILKGRFCERTEFPTGTRVPWAHTRTGNVLMGRHLLEAPFPFDPKFPAGGEDVNFFRKTMERGSVFVWCNEAPVHEVVPPARLRVSYFIKRAFLQGNVSARYHRTMDRFQDKAGSAMKSLVAFLLYTAMLPFALLAGFHVFMKYLIKDTHHVSRLLAMAGIVVVTTREI